MAPARLPCNDLFGSILSLPKRIPIIEENGSEKIRNKIERAENSGFTSDNKAQILRQSKDLLDG